MTITTLSPQDYDSAVTRNQGLGQLFFYQAQQSASSVAVVDGDVSITYRELHFLACRLAGTLSKETVSREEPVGIVAQHGVADIVAQMAVVYAYRQFMAVARFINLGHSERSISVHTIRFTTLGSESNANRLTLSLLFETGFNDFHRILAWSIRPFLFGHHRSILVFFFE